VLTHTMSSLEETRFYKDIADEVRQEDAEKHLEERLEHELNLLRELKEEGSLTLEAFDRKKKLIEQELATIRVRQKRD